MKHDNIIRNNWRKKKLLNKWCEIKLKQVWREQEHELAQEQKKEQEEEQEQEQEQKQEKEQEQEQ